MNRREIETCNNKEELRRLCLAFYKMYSFVSETCVEEVKREVTSEGAISEIRHYIARNQFEYEIKQDETDVFEKIGDRVELLSEINTSNEGFITYGRLGAGEIIKPGEQFTIQQISPYPQGTVYILLRIRSEEDFFPYEYLGVWNKPNNKLFNEYFKVVNREEFVEFKEEDWD